MTQIPKAFSDAKEKLEDKHEELDVTITSTQGTLVVKRGDDYMEIRTDGKWAWKSERDLPVDEEEGELNQNDRDVIIGKVESHILT